MGDKKPVRPGLVGGRTRFVSRFQKRLRAQRNFGFATKKRPQLEMELLGRPNSHLAGLHLYVFVNVVVVPRYVVRVQPGSGGLKDGVQAAHNE